MNTKDKTKKNPSTEAAGRERIMTRKKQEYVTSIRMPVELKDRLVAVARREQRSLNNLMVAILSDGMDTYIEQ